MLALLAGAFSCETGLPNIFGGLSYPSGFLRCLGRERQKMGVDWTEVSVGGVGSWADVCECYFSNFGFVFRGDVMSWMEVIELSGF